MYTLEKDYIEYCELNNLPILETESIDSFFSASSTHHPEELLDEIDHFELNFDIRPLLTRYFVQGLCKILKHPWPIFSLYYLTLKEDLTITERQEKVDLLTLPYMSRHAMGHLKRNDYIAIGLYITECLRSEHYKYAFEFGSKIFETKYKNIYLKNFFESYIKIFSNEEIDPFSEFDTSKFGTFEFISDILYFLYYLREEDKEKARDSLNKLEATQKEIYYLFALGFCSTKIDVTSTPSIKAIKNFGKIDPMVDYEAYKYSVYDFILFLKVTCSYCFNYFYNMQTFVADLTTEIIDNYMSLLSVQEKMIALVIMVLGFRAIDEHENATIQIQEVKNAITYASKEDDTKEGELNLKFFIRFLSNDQEEFNNTLIELQNHGMISDLNFEKGTFIPLDELFAFTNAFSAGLMTAFKNNPDMFDEKGLEDLSISITKDDDFTGHES